MTLVTTLQAGCPKSGNFWLHRILRAAEDRAGRPHRSFIVDHPVRRYAETWELGFEGQADIDALNIEPWGCGFRIRRHFVEPVADIDDYLGKCSLVWTHSPICRTSFAVLPKFSHIVYIVRDPRDMALSAANYAFKSHMLSAVPPNFDPDPPTWLRHMFDGLVREWVTHVGGYLRHRERFGVHVVFYERLLRQFDDEVGALLDYLGIRLSPNELSMIREEVAFESLRASNPEHLRRGQAGGWRRDMADQHVQRCARVASRLLGLLNYPIERNDGDLLPRLDPAMPNEALEDAVLQAKRGPIGELVRVASFLASDRSFRYKAHRINQWLRALQGKDPIRYARLEEAIQASESGKRRHDPAMARH